MSLKISNLATEKQRAILKKLEYQGTGKYAADKLTVAEAADIITELFQEQRLIEKGKDDEDYDHYLTERYGI